MENYKYLGVEIDDNLSLKQELQKKKALDRQLDVQKRRMNYMHLNEDTRYHLWQALLKSRLWYSIVITSRLSPQIENWASSYLYDSVKQLK